MNYLQTFKIQFKSIFDSAGLMILLFIGPIFLIYFMGGVYVNDYINDIPVAILDEDQSTMSRMIGTYFAKDERFEVVAYPSSKQAMEAMIDEGQVHVGLWMPKGMEEGAATFQSTEILLIVDGTNLVVANNAYAQATTIIQTVSAGIEMKLLEGKGLTPMTSMQIAKVINVGERILFDSKLTYMSYLILPFLAVFLQQLYLSSMGSMLIRNHDRLAHGSVVQNALGTSTAIIVGFIPATVVCMLTIRYLYHVPIAGNLWLATGMALIFMVSLTGPALVLASLTKDRVTYSQFSLMLSLPTFVASGCVWPVDQMPKALARMIRFLWPLINFAKPVQEVLIKDRSFRSVIPNMAQMVLYGMVTLVIGVLVYRKAFNQDPVEVVNH